MARNALSRAERDLYLAQRTRADLNALKRGGLPAVATRIVRRTYHRKLIGLLRKGGLW